MGGGGFAADAVNSMRANRLLRKKRKFRDIKGLVIKISGKTEFEFNQVSPEELELIKAQIRKEAKRAAEKEIIIYVVCILIVLLLIGFAFI